MPVDHEIGRTVVKRPGAKALVWLAGELYDVAAGMRHVHLDGSPCDGSDSHSYGGALDAVVASPSGELLILMTTAGTRALLLDRSGRVLRELDRGSNFAESYRYPAVLFELPDGGTGLVHCPDEYDCLEVEVAATGKRLIEGDRSPEDFFHSRLAVSASGRYLLSAGWIRHPWGCLSVYDLHGALAGSGALDGLGDVYELTGLHGAEVSGACFVGDDVVLSTSSAKNNPRSPDDLEPNALARWSPVEGDFLWKTRLPRSAGDLIELDGALLAVHEHPRLYSAEDGTLLQEWPDLATGQSDSAVLRKKGPSGPARTAVDQAGRRFVYTDEEQITVVELGQATQKTI